MFLAIDARGLGDRHAVPGLLVAAGVGASVGSEREVRDREAGSRTQLPVALGACPFTLVSACGFHDFLHSGVSVRGVGRRR
jgi:uncharacterized membrane protein YhiD involved in acid resistance